MGDGLTIRFAICEDLKNQSLTTPYVVGAKKCAYSHYLQAEKKNYTDPEMKIVSPASPTAVTRRELDFCKYVLRL